MTGIFTDAPVEAPARQIEPFRDAFLGEDFVPSRQPTLAIFRVFAAQHFVERVAQRRLATLHLIVLDHFDAQDAGGRNVILEQLLLAVTAFQTRREEVRRIRTDLAAEQIERITVPEIDVLLDDVERDSTELARVAILTLLHQLRGASDYAPDAGLTDEHVVSLFGQHEFAGAGQRLESRFGQRAKPILAVAVGEQRESIKVQPVVARLIEGLQDARLVGVAAAALQQLFGLLTPVASEISVQQIDHRPQMAALLDVNLKQVAQVVKRRAGVSELSLLFDRGRLGVALCDDDATQRIAKFAWNFLIRVFAVVVAEANLRVRGGRRQKDAPAIIGHLYVVVMRPPVRLNTDGSAQINISLLKPRRPHLAPPVQVIRQPFFQRALQALVIGKIDVIRNAVV